LANPRVDAAAGLLELRSEPGPAGSRGMPGFPARPYGEDSGRWRLEAANREQPLETVVAAARSRNLAVGLGVLLLLLAAVTLVVVTAGRAQRLADRQMEFVAAVSHDLRTPLAVIRSTSENLADGVVKDPSRVRQYGGIIRDQSQRLGEMIEDVLSFAGASSPDRARRDDPVAVATLVDGALEALAPALRDQGFEVERHVAEGLPTIRGDGGKLRLALRNLVENAMKYDGGARWLAVRAGLDPRDSSVVIVSVEDRGPGIAADDLPHVFEPFYRGRSAQDGSIQGFGLGLALVKRTVEDHGGRVTVASAPGRGTTFGIRLPAGAISPARAENGVDGLPDPAR
jgi:signal transduction histidine kinase